MNINIHNVVSAKTTHVTFPATETYSPFSRVSVTVRDEDGMVYELKLFSNRPITIEDGGEE